MPSKLHMSAAAPAKGDYVTLSSKNLLVVAVFPPRMSTGHCPDGKAPSSGSCVRVMTTGAFPTNGSGINSTAAQICAIVGGALSIPTMHVANGDDINSERSSSAAFRNWFANGGNTFHRSQWQFNYNQPSSLPTPTPHVVDVWTNYLYSAGTAGFVYCFADVAY